MKILQEILNSKVLLEEGKIEFEDVKLVDSTLEQTAETLKSILRPSDLTLKEVYCQFLSCTEKTLVKSIKKYSLFRSKIWRYALMKILDEKEYLPVDIDFKSEKTTFSLSKERNDLQIIQIGPNKEVKIPTHYHLGIEKGNKRFILQAQDDFDIFCISFFYEKNDEGIIDEFVKHIDEWIKENNFYKKAKISPNGKFIDVKDYTWKDVFLDEDVKKQLVLNIVDFFEKEKIYKANGISSKCGLIWEGPPGTGKTLTAKILANVLNDITFIWVTPDDVFTPKDVANIYDMARELSPSIVFFEDADLFCTQRSLGSDNRVLGEIMNQLDGLVPLEGVVTIFTSNDPGTMEKALIDRPGRFDERIEFLLPKKDIIIKLLKNFLDIPHYNDKDLPEIAENIETMKLSGAHIKRVCDLATIYAINEKSLKGDIAVLDKEHFFKALNKMQKIKIKAVKKDDYLEPREYGPIRSRVVENTEKKSILGKVISEIQSNKR